MMQKRCAPELQTYAEFQLNPPPFSSTKRLFAAPGIGTKVLLDFGPRTCPELARNLPFDALLLQNAEHKTGGGGAPH